MSSDVICTIPEDLYILGHNIFSNLVSDIGALLCKLSYNTEINFLEMIIRCSMLNYEVNMIDILNMIRLGRSIGDKEGIFSILDEYPNWYSPESDSSICPVVTTTFWYLTCYYVLLPNGLKCVWTLNKEPYHTHYIEGKILEIATIHVPLGENCTTQEFSVWFPLDTKWNEIQNPVMEYFDIVMSIEAITQRIEEEFGITVEIRDISIMYTWMNFENILLYDSVEVICEMDEMIYKVLVIRKPTT
jgi:hypothetical protein